jgi:hypothetical protein
MEFAVIDADVTPRNYLRIGINYHANKVQHLQTDPTTGLLIGWNSSGDALGTGNSAKVFYLISACVELWRREPFVYFTPIRTHPPGNACCLS